MLFDPVINFFFPSRCLLCGSPAQEFVAPVCADCWSALESERFTDERQPERLAPLVERSIINEIFFAYHFTEGGTLQRLVHLMKYSNCPTLGIRLGEKVGEAMRTASIYNDIDVLVPVPVHGSRFRERRYNQSERIARGIAARTKLPIERLVLRRALRTQPQAALNAAERAENIQGAFVATESVRGKRIGLVDDVITTGATINECARVLRAAGAESVCSVTVAAAW
jgi:ComF family protein